MTLRVQRGMLLPAPINGWAIRLCLSALACLVLGPHVMADHNSIDIQRASDVWRQREEVVVDAEVQWRALCSYSVSPARTNASKIAVADVSFELPAVKCLLAGNRMRYETEQIDLTKRASNATSDHGQYFSTFDGDRSMQMTSATAGNNPQGIIHSESTFNDIDNINLRPLLYCFRPLSAIKNAISLSNCKVISLEADVGGQKCILLRDERQNGKERRSYWLAAERGYTVARYLEEWSDTPFVQLDISYVPHDLVGWVPSEWTSVFFLSNRKVDSTSHVDVTSCRINSGITRDAFHITFLAGTLVEDRRANHKYIVRPNGDKRLVSAAEVLSRMSYNDLLNSETDGKQPSKFRAWHAVVVGMLVVGCALIAMRVVAKHK